MEGPYDFDLWCSFKKNKKNDAIEYLERVRKDLSKIQILKLVIESINKNEIICLYTDLGWEDVEKLKKERPNCVDEMKVSQSTYEPKDKYYYCKKHNLYHVIDEGCPICTNNYIKKVIDGRGYI